MEKSVQGPDTVAMEEQSGKSDSVATSYRMLTIVQHGPFMWQTLDGVLPYPANNLLSPVAAYSIPGDLAASSSPITLNGAVFSASNLNSLRPANSHQFSIAIFHFFPFVSCLCVCY